MHLKPINRQGKKRRKLKSKPSLSCDYGGYQYRPEEEVELTQSPQAHVDTKKDKAAA
jgi:hypothetical protein